MNVTTHTSKTVPKAQTQTTLLDTFECVEANGGDVVFAALADGGDIPVAVTSVYSEHDLRTALRAAGYARDAIDNAFAVYLRGDSGRRAARLAESRAHDHPVQVRTESVATGQSDTGADTDSDAGAGTDADGLDRGEGILADGGTDAPECLFCGGEVITKSRWKNVTAHSHHGTKQECHLCERCGGGVIVELYGSRRSNQLGPLTVTGKTWHIPDGYCMLACPECGEVGGGYDLSDETDRAIIEDICGSEEYPHTPCCDVEMITRTQPLRCDADGKPVPDIPERRVA